MTTNFAGVSRLKLDDFFKDIDEIPKLGAWKDWDDPAAIKWNRLVQAAQDLKQGKYAIVPNYSRKDDRTVGEKCVFSSPIILVDGFLTLHDERLRDLLDLSFFFNLSEDSQLKRRKERQPWVEDGYLDNVMLPRARQYVIPSAQYADVIVNAEISKQGIADFCNAVIRGRIADRIKKLDRKKIFQTVPIRAKV